MFKMYRKLAVLQSLVETLLPPCCVRSIYLDLFFFYQHSCLSQALGWKFSTSVARYLFKLQTNVCWNHNCECDSCARQQVRRFIRNGPFSVSSLCRWQVINHINVKMVRQAHMRFTNDWHITAPPPFFLISRHLMVACARRKR